MLRLPCLKCLFVSVEQQHVQASLAAAALDVLSVTRLSHWQLCNRQYGVFGLLDPLAVATP